MPFYLVMRVMPRLKLYQPKSKRTKTLKQMGIKTDADYFNYVRDCMAGHGSIYR